MIKIKSYSHVWKVDGVLYQISDVKLPFPITYTYMKWLMVSFILVIFLKNIPPFIFMPTLMKIALPLIFAYFMSKKQFNGKTAPQFVKSQISYFLRPKLVYRNKALKKVQKHKITSDITCTRNEVKLNASY